MAENVYVAVKYDSHSYVTRPRRSDDEWDADDVAFDMTPRGLRRVSEREWWEFVVPAPALPSYWLVWYRYSTGDSFHREDGRWTFVHLCRTREDAEYLTRKLEHAGRNEDHLDSFKDVEYELPSGDVASVFPTWRGYFETFEGADYEEFILKGYTDGDV